MTRRSQVLPFTLTEIFVLLFFALALALVWQSTARAEAEDDARAAEDEARAAQEAIQAVEATLGPAGVRELARVVRSLRDDIPDDFTELVRAVREQSTARETLETHLIAAGADSAFVDTASTPALVDSLLARLADGSERAASLERALEQATDHPDALATCLDDRAASRRELDDAQRELDNARGQAEACYRTHGRGLVHPPCWANRQGQIEYAFTVVMSTNSVTLTPTWPEYRRPDAERTPGMMQAAGRDLSYGELSRRALPIFEWSTRQDPECRHFVRIVDQVDGKDAFKRNLLTVERFFYKLLVD